MPTRLSTIDSRRVRRSPIRIAFLQQSADTGDPIPGPLAEFVKTSDHRGLLLWMLTLTKASGEDFSVTLAATVWARALGFELPETKSSRTAISKTWTRLERRHLIMRQRAGRHTRIRLLLEDGSGNPYDATPGAAKHRYFRIPHAFWQSGPADGTKRWYETLTLPEVAILMIARSLGNDFRLPLNDIPDWYGISSGTASRGIARLKEHGLLTVVKHFKPAPLAPQGYTAENRYTLQAPFGPMAVSSRAKKREMA